MRTCEWGDCGHHCEPRPPQSKPGNGYEGHGWGRGWPYLLGGGGLISVAHWQSCLCTGHAGISSQLFYIMKICMLGKFQGTAAINLLHSLLAQQGFCRTESPPPCRKSGSGSHESTLPRDPSLGPGPAEAACLTKAISPRRAVGRGPRCRNGPRTLSKRGAAPLINNKAKMTSAAALDKNVTKKWKTFVHSYLGM